MIGVASLGLILVSGILINIISLRLAASQPVDAFLVLGGSIQREIYVAERVKTHTQIPVLISSGSADPCIWLIFQQAQSPMDQVWLERCAQSTFGNFYFGVPILNRWNVHHVNLITSETHLPRAAWLGKILLGAHGIWLDVEVAPEQGIPGNRESWIKTTLDMGRSLGWAIVSQLIQPQCQQVLPLTSVDIETWQKEGFECEHQGNLTTRKTD
jgi:uncharacterized SAM-binding protein YcdF (DUF218 family)